MRNPTRRDLLKMTAAGGLAGLVGCATESRAASTTMPVLFISHGSPMLALADNDYTKALAEFGKRTKPKAIVVVSAHHIEPLPVSITSTAKPETIYDFYNFPDEMYKLTYPCPGDPALAARIKAMLDKALLPAELDPDRGLDHGAWVPLRIAFPAADIPVVQVSLPTPTAESGLVWLGRELAPLRRQGVLVIGSGGWTHNGAAPKESNREFGAWLRDRVDRHDTQALIDWRTAAPHAEDAHPTTDHFDPLLVVMGAIESTDKPFEIYEGSSGGFSLRSIGLG